MSVKCVKRSEGVFLYRQWLPYGEVYSTYHSSRGHVYFSTKEEAESDFEERLSAIKSVRDAGDNPDPKENG